MKNLLILMVGLLVAASARIAGTAPVDSILCGVKTDKTSYKVGEPVSITFIVENRGTQPVTLSYPTSQRFDVWVQSGTQEVWRWSSDMMFAQMLGGLTLAPGERKTFTAVWKQTDAKGAQVNPGSYAIFAQLTPMAPKPTPVKTDITVGVAPAVVKPATVSAVVRNLKTSVGTLVQLSGTYLGFKPDPTSPNCRPGPPVTRSDWAVKDVTGCLYVTGRYLLDPVKDIGKKITVSGYVRKTAKGQPYIQATNVALAP